MTYSDTILADLPVQYLRLNDASGTTATDSSGNGNNGTYENSPTLGAAGLLGDGSGDTAVGVADATKSRVNAGNRPSNVAFSVEVLFNTTSTTAAIATKGTHSFGITSQREVDIALFNGELILTFTNGTTNLLNGYQTGAFPASGETHQVVVTWDGTATADAVSVYLDGVFICHFTPSGIVSSTHNWYLGGRESTNAFQLTGTLDEWSYYDRVLSAGEVFAHWNNTGLAVDSVSITTPEANQIIQRTGTTYASGTADIEITGTYTGNPAGIEARWSGGSWAGLTVDPAGTFSGTLASQAAGQGDLEVRFTDDTGVTDTATDVGIGEVFAVMGQSNAVGFGTNQQAWAAPGDFAHYSPGLMNYAAGSWAVLSEHPFDGQQSGISAYGTCYPLLATHLMEELGVPVGFVTVGEGGTGLIGGTESPLKNEWDKDGTGANAARLYDLAVSAINDSPINAIRAILWYQGEQDAYGNGAGDHAPRASYAAAVSQLLDDLQADCAAAAGAKMIVATLSNYDRPAVTADDLTAIRMAQMDAIESDADLFIGPVGYDRTHSDGAHWKSDAELQSLARYWFAGINTALFSGTEGRGPRVSSAASGTGSATITVAFDRDLNTSDTAYTASAWDVEDDGVSVAISSVARSGSRNAVIALAAPLAGTATVSLGRGITGAGATIPRSVAIEFPDGSTDTLLAEPIEEYAITFFDGTAPTLSSATVSGGGDTIVLSYTESESPPLLPATGITGYSVTVDGNAVTVAASKTGDLEHTLTLTYATITRGQAVLVSYTGGNVTDSASTPNALANYADTAATNNSEITPGGPTAAEIAAQVRTELAVELARLDAAVTTRATADDVPAAADTASAVRTELATELAHLDTDLSDLATAAALTTAQASLTAISAKTALISSGSVTITSPVAADGTTITVVQGDSYNNSDDRAITWTGTDADQWPDLTDATLEFTATMKGAASITAVPTVVTPTGTQVFRMELASTDTDVTIGRYRYDVQATLSNGRIITLLSGQFLVERTHTDAP